MCDFVMPIREENISTVNLEVVVCVIPVVTFNSGESPEIIKEYNEIL